MITRDVDVDVVADLALSPPRAALATFGDGEIAVLPVGVDLEEPADPAASPRIVRVPEGAPGLAGRNIVVVADDGPQWFRLRSLTVRGIAEPVGAGAYRVVPTKVVAWDYGSLRDVPTPPAGSPVRSPSFSAGEEPRAQPFRAPNLEAALNSSRVMILASRSAKGTPFAVPLWFVTHDGRIYATTSASSWTVRNVAAAPQVALLLGGEGANDGNRLLVRGHARSVRGAPPPAVLARLAWLYYLQPRFAAVELSHMRLWPLRMRYYLQSRAAYVVITPEAVAECRVP